MRIGKCPRTASKTAPPSHCNCVAQWIAHQTSNLGVAGSSPAVVTTDGDPLTDWRNGSASDSSPEGYAFESRIGHWQAVEGHRRRSTHRLTSNLTSNPATSNLTSGVSHLTSGTGLESFEESRAAAAHEDPQVNSDADDDEDDVSYARPVAARSSIAWTFDETRATMQELRRQLQIEKEVSRAAERLLIERAIDMAAAPDADPAKRCRAYLDEHYPHTTST